TWISVSRSLQKGAALRFYSIPTRRSSDLFDAGLARKELRMQSSNRPSCDINQMIGESLGADKMTDKSGNDNDMIGELAQHSNARSEERRVGKECRCRRAK